MTRLADVLNADWSGKPRGLFFRDETPDDREVAMALYRSVREPELALTSWDEPMRRAFVAQQFDAQAAQYRQHYPGAEFLLLQLGDAVIGRLYLHRTQRELRLMEVTLQPSERGKGLGTALTKALLTIADQQQLPVTLHVEPFNPAYRLYQRLGFTKLREHNYYHFLQRLPIIADSPR
ncbi:MAG: GNAT family N-acetyltransferase [Xanthomonadales bacterium]|nr:GNAT family N-acetyltransferase [Xanthomonadales bacterium]